MLQILGDECLCSKNQQNAHFFMHPYKQSGRCQDVFDTQTRPDIDQTADTDALKNTTHKTACTFLPEIEHLVVRNMSKTVQLN